MSTSLTFNDKCISESCIEIKIKLNFYFALLCGALKGFMKALKDFIKSFEIPQRSALKAFIKPFEILQRSAKTKI